MIPIVMLTGLILFPTSVFFGFVYLIQEVSGYFSIPLAILIFFLMGLDFKLK